MNATVSIQEAEGFCELGLWQEAWDVFEALPLESRTTSGGLLTRLACCHAMGRREEGRATARALIRSGEDDPRRLASLYFQHDAVGCFQNLDMKGGARAVVAAIAAWPGANMEILDDEILRGAIALAREVKP